MLQDAGQRKPSSFYNRYSDPVIWFLILSNIIVAIIAIVQQWDLITVVWVYSFQALCELLLISIRTIPVNDARKDTKKKTFFFFCFTLLTLLLGFFPYIDHTQVLVGSSIFLADVLYIYYKSSRHKFIILRKQNETIFWAIMYMKVFPVLLIYSLPLFFLLKSAAEVYQYLYEQKLREKS